MRTRSIDNRQPVLTRSANWSGGKCNTKRDDIPSPNFGPYTHGGYTGVLQMMQDSVTPGYFKMLKQGQPLPVNPMVKDYLAIGAPQDVRILVDAASRENACGGNRIYWSSTLRSIDGVVAPQSVTHLPYTGHDPLNTLAVDALAAARGELWDASTFLAEVNKTLTMFLSLRRRCMERVARIRKDWERAKRKEANQRTRKRDKRVGAAILMAKDKKTLSSWGAFLQDAWLEARYGWRPTIYDFQDIVESTEKWHQTLLVRKSRSVEYSVGSSSTSWTNFGPSSVQRRTVTRTVIRFRAGVGVEANISVPAQFDPLVTTWEVIPYSFVADWFFNFGSLIQAFSPLSIGDLKWCFGTTTYATTVETQFRFNPNVNWLDYSITGLPRPMISERETTTRVPLSPQFEFGFRLNLDLLKGVDLLFLANQLRKR